MTPLAFAAPTLPPVDPTAHLDAVAGVRIGVAQGGIKSASRLRDDVLLVRVDGPDPVAAAVTTTSTAAAAPCRWTRARVPGRARGLLVNSGNANAATGSRGVEDCRLMAEAAATVLDLPPDEVLVCSTGVIGVPLPMPRLLPAISRAGVLDADGARAAGAILTTDLVPKHAAVVHEGITVAGIAKGSGMIHPGMATMLGHLVCDAAAPAVALQALVQEVTDRSFNAISVDGDMSTNDTLTVQLTGAGRSCEPGSPSWTDLRAALEAVCRHLAQVIAADGEGATCRIDVQVQGGPDDATARSWARAVGSSSLVKAAVHGRDANWGRIVGALGQAGAAGLDALDLDVAGIPVVRAGRPLAVDETAATEALGAPVVPIVVHLPGPGRGEAWGCDLSARYVAINADYRS